MIDLSKLDEPIEAQNGKPLQVPLENIIADKDQPRREFSDEAMKEFILNVGESGIKTPISIRPNPGIEGHWIINFGERRYRAALANKFDTIPCFVDELSADYDQVTENIQRDELKPIEIAMFIDRKVNDGDKKADIAKKLGKGKSFINDHMALINMPPVIEDAFNSGRCKSPAIIYVLRNLYKKYAEQLEQWLPLQDIISRPIIDKYRKETLEEKIEPPVSTSDKVNLDDPEQGDNEKTDGKGEEPTNESEESKAPKIKEKGIINKPLLTVLIDDREATLDIKLKPSHQGMVHVVYKDGTREEVNIESCKLISLIDANE